MPLLRITVRPLLAVRRSVLGGAVVLAALAGCADAPVTAPDRGLRPSEQPSRELVSPYASATVLTRLSPLPTAYKAIAIIGPAGGRFTMAKTGLTVTVPAGAVSRPTTFTVTAPAGLGVWYEFGPSGAKFAVPLTITQDLRATNVAALVPRLGDPLLEAGHFVAGTLDARTGTALVQEILPITLNSTRTAATFQVHHFSGYMVSTGRRGSSSSDE